MPKAYKIELSSGEAVRIDADELPLVIEAVKAREVVRVRQGIVNTVHLVSIRSDDSRIGRWREQCGQTLDTASGSMVPTEAPWRLLPDLFEGVLPPPGTKQLH